MIGVQVLFAGISLPAAYLWNQGRSLFMLLVPIMSLAWLVTSGLILALIPGLTWVEALCIVSDPRKPAWGEESATPPSAKLTASFPQSACVAPTDPILANSIVKGRFAEKFVPVAVRDIISAESGANDGLGYPFLFLPIYIMARGNAGVGGSIKTWFISTVLYQIGVSIAIGALLGYVGRVTLKEAHKRRLVSLAFLSLQVYHD